MKKNHLYTILISISIMLTACGNNPKTADIFQSNASAAKYLSGYWTDGKSEFFEASSDDSFGLFFDFSYPGFSDADFSYIKDGKLYDATTNSDGNIVAAEVIEFEYVDENSFSIKSLINGSKTTMIRDSKEVDPTNLDDEYVFWSIKRAGVFLNGEWTSQDGNYISIVLDDAGNASLSTSLNIPDSDFVDFCDYKLSSITVDENGIRSINPIYKFSIIDMNKISVVDNNDDETIFRRSISDFSDIDDLNEAVFWDINSTINFLEGKWSDSKGNYFRMSIKDEKITWNTSIPKGNLSSYRIVGDKMLGVEFDSDNNSEQDLYQFKVLDINKIEIFNFKDSNIYTFNRVIE